MEAEKQVNKCIKVVLWLLCVLLLLVSCKSSEPVQPEPVDLTPSINMLFDSRPKNEDLRIVEDVKTIDDIIDNSATYLMAWELWESYAYSLEDYIDYIGGLSLCAFQ